MNIKALRYSVAGLLILSGALICINLALFSVNLRWDATGEKLYSISDSTVKILSGMTRDVRVKVFMTTDDRIVPSHMKNYGKRVLDLLNEYRRRSKGKLHLEIYDPEPDSDDEDLARRYGLESLRGGSGENVWFGLAVTSGGFEETIPFLDPAGERHLEYDVTRIIASAENPKKKKIGILSTLPVFGGASRTFNPAMRGGPPWFFVRELEKIYEVARITTDSKTMPGDVDLLVIIHPKNLGPKILYAVDQYLLGGGTALIFVDPYAFSQGPGRGGVSSDLKKLFNAWGIKMDTGKAIIDFNFSTKLAMERGTVDVNPLWISAGESAFNRENMVTSGLESMLFPVAGAITKADDFSHEFEPLIQSSRNSGLHESFMSNFTGRNIRKDFKPSDERYNIAVKIRGRLDTAFPEGEPVEEKKPGEDEKKKKRKGMRGKKTAPKPAAGTKGLKRGKTAATVIVVADSDMLYDHYYVRKQSFFGLDMSQVFNDNLNFLMNSVEILAGSAGLAEIRTTGKFGRPFTKVEELEEKAQRRWLAKEQELMRKAEQANAKLRELEKSETEKNGRGKAVLDKKQRDEIRRFHEEKIGINKELKIVRRNLRSEIDALGRRIKFFNILLMPFLVCVAGLAFAYCRHRRICGYESRDK